MNKHFLHLIFFAFVPVSIFAQNPSSQIELNGFFLAQYREVFKNQHGSPLQRIVTDDNWIYEFYAIKSDSSVYMLVKSSSEDTTGIISLQINGLSYDDMHPFLGLKLGDSSDKVFSKLGRSSHIKKLDNPKVKVHYFDNRNYSVEIDKNNQLYGIQIFGYTGFSEDIGTFPDYELFRKKILEKDQEWLLYHIMPNFEIYRNDKIIYFKAAARDEMYNEDSEVYQILFGANDSVYEAFKNESLVGEQNFRLGEKTLRQVWKFKESKILKEIVFWGHAGAYKIWEITFN